MIEIDLSKQQVIDADPKAIEKINFTKNLEQQSTIFFTRNCKSVLILFFSLT